MVKRESETLLSADAAERPTPLNSNQLFCRAYFLDASVHAASKVCSRLGNRRGHIVERLFSSVPEREEEKSSIANARPGLKINRIGSDAITAAPFPWKRRYAEASAPKRLAFSAVSARECQG